MPGGQLAVNTNGGGLSCAHAGMYGLFTMVDAATQLAGTAGERQVKDAKLALAAPALVLPEPYQTVRLSKSLRLAVTLDPAATLV